MEAVPVSRGGAEPQTRRCANWGGESRPVSRKTVLLMFKPEFLERATTGTYRFCSAPDCPVVYFEEQSRHVFTTDDLSDGFFLTASIAVHMFAPRRFAGNTEPRTVPGSTPGSLSILIARHPLFPPVPRGWRSELALERAIESRLGFVPDIECNLRHGARRRGQSTRC